MPAALSAVKTAFIACVLAASASDAVAASLVTPEVTGFNYVGHEVRHCFEGAFHD